MKHRLTCGEVLLLTDAFLDDELTAPASIAVITHASACHVCRTRIDAGMRLKERVRSAAAGTVAPPYLLPDLRHTLRAS